MADVGDDQLLVHDEHRPDPSLAFALSRLADQPTSPTPVGVFRAVDRPSYEDEMQRQLVDAVGQGPRRPRRAAPVCPDLDGWLSGRDGAGIRRSSERGPRDPAAEPRADD